MGIRKRVGKDWISIGNKIDTYIPYKNRIHTFLTMRILFFDTETQGLPLTRSTDIQNVANWPRIVSVSWQVYDFLTDPAELKENETFLVKPQENAKWSLEAERIHGITRERACLEGKPIREILELFQKHSDVDIIVSHNIAFDKPILLAEFVRENMPITWWPKIEYCTMENSKQLCKLPPKTKNPKPSDPYKYPQLKELQTFLFGEAKSDIAFHTANGDVQCLVQCFLELWKKNHVPVGEWRSRLSIGKA